MSYWKLFDYVVELSNSLRGIRSLVDSEEFEFLWNKSTKEQKDALKKSIKNGDRESVKRWIDFHPTRKAEHWSYKRLRDRARKLGVYNYSRKTRGQLIREIMEHEEK